MTDWDQCQEDAMAWGEIWTEDDTPPSTSMDD